MITAIVLAAGLSRRMGKPKMLLPWGSTTVLGQVLHTLQATPVDEVLVIAGAGREAVEPICRELGARAVFNPDYEAGEMLSSLQTGLGAARPTADAALVVLGDQPGMEARVVQAVLFAYDEARAPLVIPSFQRRRGHPWLVDRGLWSELLGMRAPETPRDFLARHGAAIHYVEADSPLILEDIDTPEEYLNSRP